MKTSRPAVRFLRNALLCLQWLGAVPGVFADGDYFVHAGYSEGPTTDGGLFSGFSISKSVTGEELRGGDSASSSVSANGAQLQASGTATASGETGGVIASASLIWYDTLHMFFPAASLAEAQKVFAVVPFTLTGSGALYGFSATINDRGDSTDPATLGTWSLNPDPAVPGGTLTGLYLLAPLINVIANPGGSGFVGDLDISVSVFFHAATNEGTDKVSVSVKSYFTAIKLYQADGTPVIPTSAGYTIPEGGSGEPPDDPTGGTGTIPGGGGGGSTTTIPVMPVPITEMASVGGYDYSVPEPEEPDEELPVTSFTRQDGAVTLAVGVGQQGWTYELQRSPDLGSAPWSVVLTLGPLTEAGPLELTDPAAPAAQAFYRVIGHAP